MLIHIQRFIMFFILYNLCVWDRELARRSLVECGDYFSVAIQSTFIDRILKGRVLFLPFLEEIEWNTEDAGHILIG